MNKTTFVLLTALAVGVIALSTVPAASAAQCVTTDPALEPVVQACNEALQTAGWAINDVSNAYEPHPLP